MKLIKDSQQFYESLMQQQEDRPNDPNHQNVIDISSDEDDTYGSNDDLAEESNSKEERSTYFHPAPEVDAFNAQRT